MFKKRENYNHTISVKLFIPSYCNASCTFCYMNSYRNKPRYNKEEFIKNYIESLKNIIRSISGKNPISLDITGNEPTIDVSLLQEIGGLKEAGLKKYFSRVTMTSNGTNLKRCASFISGFVDYVNISVHSFDLNERRDIMDLSLNDDFYKDTINALRENGIKTSAVCVIHKEIPDFATWRENFVNWAKDLGFIGLRFRCDVFWKQSNLFERYMKESIADTNIYKCLIEENTPDSHWCRLRRYDKFRVFFLHGVEKTNDFTKGIEYVIMDDGKAYTDYDKHQSIENYKYKIGEIYDKV